MNSNTPPTPDEVERLRDAVDIWHQSMPFYNDDLGALLEEFDRLRTALPKMRAERDAMAAEAMEYRSAINFETTCTSCARTLDKLVRVEAERDEAIRSAEQSKRISQGLTVSNNELHSQEFALNRDLKAAQHAAQVAMDAGVAYLQEVKRLESVVAALQEINDNMATDRQRLVDERDKYMQLAQQWRKAALEGVVRDIEGEDEG